jgi:hypothetical protein
MSNYLIKPPNVFELFFIMLRVNVVQPAENQEQR